MRRSRALVFIVSILFLFTISFVQPVLSQAPKPPAAPKPAVSDAELDKLYTDVTTGDWDPVAHPAVNKIATLDAASKAKLVPRFMKVLDSEDHSWAVEEALGAIGAQALPELLKAAQNETGARQQNAVGAIGKVEPKAKSAIPVLIKLSKTTDKDLRGWVIGSLGKIGPAGPGALTTPQVVEIMLVALNDDVAGCESVLAQYGAPVVPGLRKILQTSTDVKLQGRAAKALMFMGPPAAPAVPELMVAAKNPELRETAIYALVKIGPAAKPAAPMLKKVVMKDPEYWSEPKSKYADDRPRMYAMQALAVIGTDNDFLIQAAKDNAPGAEAALSKVGAPIVPVMRNFLNGSDPAMKKMALRVLCGVGTKAEPVVPDLIQLMGDKDYAKFTVSVLGCIGPASKPAVPAIINALYDENQRFQAILTLQAIGPGAKDAVPYLIDILQGKPEFSQKPPPPGYTYKYGEKLGNIGRMMADLMDEDAAKDALTKIGTPEALSAIEEYKEKKEAVDPNENLYDAVSRNHAHRVKVLLTQGSDPNATGGIGLGWLPLHAAANNDNAEIAKLLLDKGANPNGICNASKQTPLMAAADHGSKNVALALLDKDANANARDDSGMTVLLFAIEAANWKEKGQNNADTDIVRALLDKGADPNAAKDGWTPLMYAAARGKTEIARLLVQKKVDVNAGKDGNTALSLAQSNGHADIVKILKAAGAK